MPEGVQNRMRAWDPLLAVQTFAAGARLFSLQLPASGVAACPAGVIDLAPRLVDFSETAAALRNLDLLISAETAVAHLAGALGVPVWLPMPPTVDWRWEVESRQSPWYASVRLFPPAEPMHFQSAFAAMAQAFAAREYLQAQIR